VIEATGVIADRVTLEITEHLQADDSERMLSRLNALKRIGVRLAIDDFGSYSSLSYLRSFPIDLLKIDRSFIADISRDSETARLVRGIVDMGHALHLEIVTEGMCAFGAASALPPAAEAGGQRLDITADVSLIPGSTISYHGTAKITEGSGAYRSVRAHRLRVSGSGPLSGETFHVRLTGS
jgi:hypothetical protein